MAVTVDGSDSAQCNNNPRTSVSPYDTHKDRGGLNAMCRAAEGMRHDIIEDTFPYGFAAQQAKLW